MNEGNEKGALVGLMTRFCGHPRHRYNRGLPEQQITPMQKIYHSNNLNYCYIILDPKDVGILPRNANFQSASTDI